MGNKVYVVTATSLCGKLDISTNIYVCSTLDKAKEKMGDLIKKVQKSEDNQISIFKDQLNCVLNYQRCACTVMIQILEREVN